MKKLFNFKRCLTFGILANVMFILFIIICLVYYSIYGNTDKSNNLFEMSAYICEAVGFVLMALSIVGMVLILRQRYILKILLSIYLITEIFIMLLDFGFINIGKIYNGYSVPLIIVHAIFSAAVCFSHISLDHKRLPLQIAVSVASCMMLAGMLSVGYGVRIYASVLTNCFAYLFLYITLSIQLKLEVIEVDCHGDKARVQEYKSSFFK